MKAAFGEFPGVGLLEGKIAVIIGAGRGIGKVTAEVFVQEGAKVVVADVSGDETDVVKGLGTKGKAFHLDVTDERQVEELFAFTLDHYGRVDASVHAAGPLGGRRTPEITVEEFEDLYRGHLLGMLLCSKHAVKAMVPRGGGAILNFSSVASLNADLPPSIGYSAAKAGINAMTKSFAVEYGTQGIRANAILPGVTLSEKVRELPNEALARLGSKAALRRAAEPAEQANVAAFLCSDRASYLTGAIIPVDGGWSARLA